MPIQIPTLDDRKYQDLLDEALARIPVHTPEWTNFNKSDPGVTLIEVFAFLTESLLYRTNQIPERNRKKYLSLLGVPLQPASSARGIVTLSNERGPLKTVTLNDGLQVLAGQVPFRTELGLDVLPIEAQAYFKRPLTNPSDQVRAYYKQLYISHMGQPPATEPLLYEVVSLSPRTSGGVDLAQTVDGSLWIALLVRAVDKPYADNMQVAREAIALKTLSLGMVPMLDDASRALLPGSGAAPSDMSFLRYLIPDVPADGLLPRVNSEPRPRYRQLDASATVDVLTVPGVVQITLPDSAQLGLWSDLDPLEAGVGDLPPALDDTAQNERVITWLRVYAPPSVRAKLLWAGVNATMVNQRAHVANELLPAGTGEPDQSATFSKTPVVPQSVRITVTASGKSEVWQETDDLMTAGPEVPVPDLRQPPGALPPLEAPTKVFVVDAEAGQIRFGDGLHGARPPLGATIRADYDYGQGQAGNVGADSINVGPALPIGLKVTNPVRTWGGADAEKVSEGEKQITRYLQHRDRLVTAEDFETIALRTPGVEIGRVEVLPAFNPNLSVNAPGDAPGAVTLMVIPKYDASQPDAPRPDRLFLDAICEYLDSRRLVTTEVFLRGPIYKPIWLSVGLNVVPGASVAQVREAVKQALLSFLSPLPPSTDDLTQAAEPLLTAPDFSNANRGWPLRKPVVDLELLAVASRVPGVLFVNQVLIAQGSDRPTPSIGMTGLELPRLVGISVSVGDATPLDQLRGQALAGAPSGPGVTAQPIVPVPVIPEECK